MGKKNIKKNQECWVENCEEEIKEWPYCKKHQQMTLKGHWLKLKVTGIKGFDNTPGRY